MRPRRRGTALACDSRRRLPRPLREAEARAARPSTNARRGDARVHDPRARRGGDTLKPIVRTVPPAAHAPEVAIERLDVAAYEVPTDGPGGKEADGTLEWSATTAVVVEAHGGGETGIGYTYGDVATARFVESMLAGVVTGKNALTPPAVWHDMQVAIRNAGRPGLGAMAVSAVDVALHDLAARLLDVPLYRALGAFRTRTPVYGSGGFCNYPLARLADQLSGWVAQGIPRVKLKTSRHPDEDPKRLDAVRAALGDAPLVLTDANGALGRKQALYWAQRFREQWNVAWMEEPVSSADFEGLRFVREHGPGGLEVAAGEYGFVIRDFLNLLEARAVDCLQADVTRCGGVTGLMQVAGLCSAYAIDLSAHCAPAISAHAFCAVERARHLEYFHDHVRVESMLFDGVLAPVGGCLAPDPSRPGLGLALKRRDVADRLVYGREGRR